MAKPSTVASIAAYALQLAPHTRRWAKKWTRRAAHLSDERGPRARSRPKSTALRGPLSGLHGLRHRLPFWRGVRRPARPFRAHAEKTRHRPSWKRRRVCSCAPRCPIRAGFAAVRLGKRLASPGPCSPLRCGLCWTCCRTVCPHPRRCLSESIRKVNAALRVALLTGCVKTYSPRRSTGPRLALRATASKSSSPKSRLLRLALASHRRGRIKRDLARHNLRVFPHDVDAIITNAPAADPACTNIPCSLPANPMRMPPKSSPTK